jgi:site-specific DNA-methyltransferase (adenine-specific)
MVKEYVGKKNTVHAQEDAGGDAKVIRIPEIQDRDLSFLQVVDGLARAKQTKSFKSGIVCGDVIKTLKKLSRNHKFDVIIADPPYNIGKDFGNSNDQMSMQDYIKWTENWLKLCFDLLSDNGLIYVYGFAEILAHIAVKYPMDKQKWLAWHYTNKAVPTSTFWQRSHESILCLWQNKRPDLEIEQIREPYTDSYLKCAGKVRKATKGRFSDGTKETLYQVNENGALPRDVIKMPALAGGAGNTERWFMCKTCGDTLCSPTELKKHKDHNTLKHPTQKPMKLTKRLIQSRINGNGGRTLVPFAGSGSECVVAKALGIEFLGVELNPEYVNYANKWLLEVDKGNVCID